MVGSVKAFVYNLISTLSLLDLWLHTLLLEAKTSNQLAKPLYNKLEALLEKPYTCDYTKAFEALLAAQKRLHGKGSIELCGTDEAETSGVVPWKNLSNTRKPPNPPPS